ncbi:MAG: acyl-CoA dehydratase activase, partial [Patescibacteria group bacterium]|nr:acyl-CoA dehydratase activase [Patescibacteria group bacterium]
MSSQKDVAHEVFIGLDSGSVSTKIAVVDLSGKILEERYERHYGQPLETSIRILQNLLTRYGKNKIKEIAITGMTGKIISELLGASYTNEVISVTAAVGELYPEIRTIIEMGGEDSKLIILKSGETEHEGSLLEDFSMNAACAAGTGSFLDQQASRLGIRIEEDFGRMALQSKVPPRIAGRCSVFAKSDMIHLQQIGTPDYDIVSGLCFAVARNFKSTIAKGKQMTPPIAFIGGVASNSGMVRAFREVLELPEDVLIIPPHHATLGAIGTALLTIKNPREDANPDFARLFNFNKSNLKKAKRLEPLRMEKSLRVEGEVYPIRNGEKIEAFIGVDIGSVSTNVVAIDRQKRVLSRCYLPTAGRPIEAVKQGLEIVGTEVGDKITVMGVGTTGSGRYMIGDLIGADIVRNEITAQARAAIEIDPSVDTIFEIGGQDSKYISVDNGVVVNFEMNKVCAAGTGSFLEEQAERLNINIKNEFSDLALSCSTPCKLGERCTVFIESDLVSQQQAGASREELVSGLAYSIALNYLNRVVGKRRVGNNIFFQGGTANNKAVVAAFEKITGKRITVPPHNDVTGAIGIAILSMESNSEKVSKFKGFDFSKRNYALKSFVCKDCSNLCEIKRVKFENEKPLFYGSRCEKFDFDKKFKKGEKLPDLFDERERLLLGPLYDKSEGVRVIKTEDPLAAQRSGKPRIGIPRFLQFYENFPYWKTFFETIGWEIVLSDRTSREVIHDGSELVTAEFCFPIKVAFGATKNMMKKNIDYIFLPSIISQFKTNARFSRSYNCPFVQSIPYSLRSNFNFQAHNIKTIEPHLNFQKGRAFAEQELQHVFKKYGVKPKTISQAMDAGEAAQKVFQNTLQERGDQILQELQEGKYERGLIVIGRSYNTCDDGMNMDLPRKLKDLGVLAIPMDMVRVEDVEVWQDHPNMYWKYGQRIVGAAEVIKKRGNVF